MAFNYDYTRKDGTEVMVCYRKEVGSADEWDEIERAILADPPEHEPLPDDVY